MLLLLNCQAFLLQRVYSIDCNRGPCLRGTMLYHKAWMSWASFTVTRVILPSDRCCSCELMKTRYRNQGNRLCPHVHCQFPQPKTSSVAPVTPTENHLALVLVIVVVVLTLILFLFLILLHFLVSVLTLALLFLLDIVVVTAVIYAECSVTVGNTLAATTGNSSRDSSSSTTTANGTVSITSLPSSH